MTNPMIGQSVGRYHILEQLGEGGMATVYKAFDTVLEREVAVKIILPSRQQTPKFLSRFEREAKALAQLSHPNIVKIMDYGEHNGLPFLVMEYTPGGTLKGRLGEAMPWQEAASLLEPIARALEYTHERKIIHRDVKPSNVLIADSGEPMLSDFGIAKVLEPEKTWDLTGTGVGIGTPEYMAPEQGMGKAVDHRADIYALGIVFYELVTGRKPFRADTPLAVLMKHVNDPLPPPNKFVSDIPKSVEQVIFKALAKNVEDRFQIMADFTEALKSVAKQQKVTVKAVPRWKSERARRMALIGGLAAVAIVVVTVALWGTGSFTDGFDLSFLASKSTPEAEPTGVAQASQEQTKEAVTLTSAHASELNIIIYDDFESPGGVNPLRWYRETDFQVEDGVAVLKAWKGDYTTHRTNLDPTNRWALLSSGTVRFSIETRIRIDSTVKESRKAGSAGIQLIGPEIPPDGTWAFELGYVFDAGWIGYQCVGFMWPGTSYHQRTFGTTDFDEWHTLRISIVGIPDSDDVAIAAYVDDEKVCYSIPPSDWQDRIDRGDTVSLLLVNGWQRLWDSDQAFKAFFDDVKVGSVDG